MARRWPIRYKLMLGFAVVIVLDALLVAGMVYGMISSQSAMRMVDSKAQELVDAQKFQLAVNNLQPQGTGSLTRSDDPTASNGTVERVLTEHFGRSGELKQLLEKIAEAEQKLGAYVDQWQETMSRQRDPDRSGHKARIIEDVRKDFKTLEKVARDAAFQPETYHMQRSKTLLDYEDVQRSMAKLVGDADELIHRIYDDIFATLAVAKRAHTRSLVFVVGACVFGVCLLAGMLHGFYGWVFHPIRDLQAGAGRVAQGDFDRRIDVDSGDEMEDLAHAFNDMTDRLRDMYADLERQVNERSRQLVRSERLASVGFLAAGVAHEINNPLASIAFCSEALESRLESVLHGPTAPTPARRRAEDVEVVTKYLRMIQEEAFRCKDITGRLLEFSRGGELRREPADLVELVQAVLDMVQHLQNGKGKRIVLNAPPRLIAPVNAQEIKSVVLNLVVNALDSMDDGGTLTIALDAREDRAEMHFADTGCGMTPEVLDNIFEPFFTRSRTGKGTGLGLSISHRVITQHGGEIEAVSPGPDQGSTFTVRLPLRIATETAKEDYHRLAA